MTKLLFIGGHHNSALATIDWLRANSTSIEFYWIGKKFVEGGGISPEYTEVTSKNIPFFALTAGKLFRTTSIRFLPQVIYNLMLVPFGFIQAFYYLLKIKPQLIVSFGGYLGVPVVIAGSLLGIKSVLHEQTATIGLANEISAVFAKKIFTTWPKDFYSNEKISVKRKIQYTGLPIRNSITLGSEKIKFPREAKTIYLTGGKSGSLFINKIMLEVLEEFSKKYNIIWSTGRRVGEADYEAISTAVNELPKDISKNILVKEYFLEDEIGKVFNSCDLVISRGGAHTIYELALLKKPAIIIPIPWVSRQEQLKNAKILEKFGLAKVLNQQELSPYKLVSEVEDFISKLDSINNESKDKNFVPNNGGEKVGHAILESIAS